LEGGGVNEAETRAELIGPALRAAGASSPTVAWRHETICPAASKAPEGDALALPAE
jgi:hypothetical protein